MTRLETGTEKIVAESADGIGWLTFNNPERRNAMDLAMWQGMGDALDAFDRDPAVRVVILKGAGDKAFLSGADISQFETERSDAAKAAAYGAVSDTAKRRLTTMETPVVSMIRGFCIGGGLAVAMSTDMRIAAEDAQFAIPAGRLGLAYEYESLKKLTDLVGPAFAKDILFTARRLDAREALRIGLVNRVVPVGGLEAAVRDVADAIVSNAPLTLRAAKIAIDATRQDAGSRDETAVKRSYQACFDSADYAEGRRAFMEKRKPAFTGR